MLRNILRGNTSYLTFYKVLLSGGSSYAAGVYRSDLEVIFLVYAITHFTVMYKVRHKLKAFRI